MLQLVYAQSMNRYIHCVLVCAFSVAVSCTGSPQQSTSPPPNGNITQTGMNSGLVLMDPVSNLIRTYSFFTIENAATAWPYIVPSPAMSYFILNTNATNGIFIQVPPVLIVPLTPLAGNTSYTFQVSGWSSQTGELGYNSEQVTIPFELPYSSFTSTAWCIGSTAPYGNSPFNSITNAVEIIDYHPASGWMLAVSSISCSTISAPLVFSGYLYSGTTVSLQTAPSDITFFDSSGNEVSLASTYLLPGSLRFVRAAGDTINGEVLNFMAITGYSPGLSSFFQGASFEAYLAGFSGSAFSPASLPVGIQSVTPADGSTGVPVTAAVQASFSNTTLGMTDHTASVILEDEDATTVYPPASLATNILTDAAGTITAITAVPTVPLSGGATYRAFILFDWTPVASISFTTQ